MLNPSVIADAVVTTLQGIPDLVAAMGSKPENIKAYHYLYGQDGQRSSLTNAIYTMAPPSTLVAWEGTQGGNFNGQTICKHKVSVYLRSGNVATSQTTPTAYEYLWWLICNASVNGHNIRSIQILPGQLDIMDTPSISMLRDEEGIDFACGKFVIPEIGDQ